MAVVRIETVRGEVPPAWWQSRLLALVAARQEAAAQDETALVGLIAARRELSAAEITCWQDGRLDAVKPAERREAELRAATWDESRAVEDAEQAYRQARNQLKQVSVELDVMLALGRLVANADGPGLAAVAGGWKE